MRDRDLSLAPLRFLFDSYRCDCWWFEVAEIYRRVVFVSVIPLMSTNTARRASLGCVLAILSLLFYREEQPFRTKFTNLIAYVAQAAILMTFYGALAIQTGVMYSFGLGDLGMGLFLALANILVLALALVLGLRRLARDRKAEADKVKALEVQPAAGFTAEKFRTTFEAVALTSVPASHVLAFHYTTLAGAKKALRSGLPAHDALGGVAVTLRHPHGLTAAEVRTFAYLGPWEPDHGAAEAAAAAAAAAGGAGPTASASALAAGAAASPDSSEGPNRGGDSIPSPGCWDPARALAGSPNCFEAVLVLVLPARVLRPLTASAEAAAAPLVEENEGGGRRGRRVWRRRFRWRASAHGGGGRGPLARPL